MTLTITSTASAARALRMRGQPAVDADDFLTPAGALIQHSGVVRNCAGPLHYLSRGYYCSLVAEARGLRVSPSVAEICEATHGELVSRPEASTKLLGPMAILCMEQDEGSPSDARSNRYFARLAARLGMAAEIIGPLDLPRLADFGGLWIRCLTDPMGIGYVFAKRAEALGIPVLDDAASILRCCNKVFAAERLAHHGVATPPTMIVGPATTITEIEAAFGYPIVLKAPDGSFSKSVVKAANRGVLATQLGKLREHSSVVIAQAFLATEFDWRIGMLAGKPLFACQYKMARGHWQIIRHREGRSSLYGGVKCVAVADVPREVIDAALAAAAAMGDGLYGVDLKQTRSGVFVMEVNDNPDLNHGTEDRAEGERPWLDILTWFRIAQMRRLNVARNAALPAVLAAYR